MKNLIPRIYKTIDDKFEVIRSNQIQPRYVCDCPIDENGNFIEDISCIELVNNYLIDSEGKLLLDSKGNMIISGKKAVVDNKKLKQLKKQEKDKRIRRQLKVQKKQDEIDQLKDVNWDRAKISDIRKAIKLLLGVE